jgi:broad specificity phosphatase PhoE
MQLAVVRHLPTLWNKNELLQGKRDIPIDQASIPLFDKSIEENKRLLEKLEPFELILASNLSRTKQTADVYGYESIKEPLIDELDFGEFEGKPKQELTQQYDWIHHPRTMTLGENMVDFEKRLQAFCDRYQRYNRILVFGHGSWIRGLLSLQQHGSIQNMNKITVENNELFQLFIMSRREQGDRCSYL